MLAKLRDMATRRDLSVSEAVERILDQHFTDDDAMRVIRETIRQEMRAEFAARREVAVTGRLGGDWDLPTVMRPNGLF